MLSGYQFYCYSFVNKNAGLPLQDFYISLHGSQFLNGFTPYKPKKSIGLAIIKQSYDENRNLIHK